MNACILIVDDEITIRHYIKHVLNCERDISSEILEAEDGGEALDPQEQYYLSMTVSTVAATAQAGTLSYIIQYVVD